MFLLHNELICFSFIMVFVSFIIADLGYRTDRVNTCTDRVNTKSSVNSKSSVERG